MTTVLHLAALTFALAIIAVILSLALLGICAALQSGAHDDPRIDADVDLDQALATVRGIAYGCTCVNGPSRGVLHRPDCPMTVQRRAHGYARGRGVSGQCCICRTVRPSAASLIEHLAQHTPTVLAEELVKARVLAAEYQSRAAMAERCGKVGYKTEQTATAALLNIWRTFGNDAIRREVRAYQCHRCNGFWHLTSQTSESRNEATA